MRSEHTVRQNKAWAGEGFNADNFRGSKVEFSPPFGAVWGLFSCGATRRTKFYVYHQLWQGSTSSLGSMLAISVEKPWAVVCGPLRKHAAFTLYIPVWCFPLLPFLPWFLFSHLPHISSTALATHMYAFPSQSCPERDLNDYFSQQSRISLRERECLFWISCLCQDRSFFSM